MAAPPDTPTPAAGLAPAPASYARAESILNELEVFGIRLGLESTRALLADLGNPERQLEVVLVAGTNGKGSTSSLLASILDAAGLRVGLYTSPHLEEVAERVRVAGRVIGSATLADQLERVVALGRRSLGHPPTYFEALTVAAYAHFAAEQVEVAVMEVGLGGRLDATNAAEPALSIVTSIARDHTQVLGSTLDAIAREKAGILRAGRTALHGVEAPEAKAALEDEARRCGAHLLDAGALARCEDEPAPAAGRRRVRVRTPAAEYVLELDMPGRYQTRNVAMAVLAAETLAAQSGFRLDAGAVALGAREWRWPGRCERVVLPGGAEVLLDAAHNEEGVAALRRELAAGWPNAGAPDARPWTLVFGALDDKPAGAMLDAIAHGAERVILTRPPSSRGIDPHTLNARLPADRVTIAEGVAEALDCAFDAGAARVVVCGSIYLVGAARRELRRRFGVPERATAPWPSACRSPRAAGEGDLGA